MIVLNDLYDYGYKIYQDSNYFKFSLDSILLAEFVKFRNNFQILDLCTGNIPVPLILYSKNRTLNITGVELQREIVDLAVKTLEVNNIKNNIKIINSDIKNMTSDEKYDIITCNPPYFSISNSFGNQNNIKNKARHEVELTIHDIVDVANKFIKEDGTFYIVQRPNRIVELINELKKYSFGIRKICFIYTKEKADAKMFLLEASKNKKDDTKVYSKNVQNLKTYQNIFKEV